MGAEKIVKRFSFVSPHGKEEKEGNKRKDFRLDPIGAKQEALQK